MAISRNLEKNVIYINKWMTGMYQQRSPLFTPLSSMGLQVISRMDTLWDGLNMDISHNMTLIRRPGFATYNTTAMNAGEKAQSFFAFKNVAGTVRSMVETNQRVATFTPTSLTTAITKHTTQQGSMSKVGDMFYYCDGNDADTVKWNGTSVSKWGIRAPDLSPTLSFSAGSLNAPNGGYTYVFVYKNSDTGHISAPSPASAPTLNLISQTVSISGQCSTDPQVDMVDIYRTADGGANHYYMASVPNTGTTWTYGDTNPDSALNDDILVTLDHANFPPPTGAHLATFFQGRYWIAAGSYLYFSGGPDIVNGVPEECFNPANVFVLPGKITAFAPTSQGLVVFTSADAYLVLGANTASYYVQKWQSNFGVLSQNCVAQDGDNVFVFTSQGQLFNLNSSLTEIGFPIQSQLATFDASKVYLALHRAGADEGLFITDATTNMWRYSVSLGSWSTVWKPTIGCGAIASIEVSPASYKLLMGVGHIVVRDTTTHADEGTPYATSVTVGSLILSSPGEVAEIQAVILEAMPSGTYPTVSILLNEVQGTFTELPDPRPDPPRLPPSASVRSMRHYLPSAQAPLARSQVRHMQVKLSFKAEDAPSEILGLAVL